MLCSSCCHSRSIRFFFATPELLYNLLRFSLAPPRAINPCAERRNDRDQVLHKVFFLVVHFVDDLDVPVFVIEKGLVPGEAKTGEPVLMLDYG